MKSRTLRVAGVCMLLAVLEQSAEAAATPEDPRWSASIDYGVSNFSPARDQWREYGASARRHWERGSLAAEYLQASRFALTDEAIALDGYLDVWSRAYANVRYQYTADSVFFPDDAYRVELFQGAGQGWELAASYDHMDFTSSRVDMYGLGLGAYRGDWYYRWKTLFIPSDAEPGVSHRAIARYYYAGNGDDYLELNGGFSHGREYRHQSQVLDITKSRSIGVAFRKYYGRQWGVKLAASSSDEKNAFAERSLSLSLLFRW
ncbi:MAG: YaiO family outer membrane beta-barrel protein [Gammaproteobacteria bacterium]|nr:YaiO family outer membrane beta-barrel protein [Gammaproteobacteria bacterium]